MFGAQGQQYNGPPILGPNGKPWQDAEGMDRDFALPPTAQFAGIIGSGSYVLYHLFDQALQEDREAAVRTMQNDLHITGPLQERTQAVVSLPWEIECDEERDKIQVAMKDGLGRVVKATPDLTTMFDYLHSGSVFKGRYGANVAFTGEHSSAGPSYMDLQDIRDPDRVEKRRVPIMHKHMPVDGDKIQWKYDGTPVILGNSTVIDRIPGAEITNTTIGRGLVIRGPEWQSRYIIHRHRAVDADFFSPREAAKSFGVGIRDALFWTSWLKNNWLGNIADFMERTGLGVRAWLYDAENPKARAEAAKAAAEYQENKTNLLVPVWKDGGGRALEGLRFIDVATSGTAVIRELITYLDDAMERYIIGQTLSSSSEGSGLGGTGVAALHAATKSKLIAFDAGKLAETLTRQWIRRLVVWIWGEEYRSLADAFHFRFVVDQPNPTESLTAASTYIQLGGKIGDNALRRASGFPEPKPGEEVISTENLQRMQMQLEQEMQATQIGQPTPPLPGEQQTGPTTADFEALLNDETPPDAPQPTEQFSRFENARRFVRDQLNGADERLRCHREGESYARDPLSLTAPPNPFPSPPAPQAPTAGKGMKIRTPMGHDSADPEYVNGKPHKSGSFLPKTPIPGAVAPPQAKLTPASPAAPAAAPPVTPDLVATFAQKFKQKYDPNAMAILRQKAQTAQGGVKLAAQALMQHMQSGSGGPSPEAFADVMKHLGVGTERHERTDLERYAEVAPKPTKPPAPKTPTAPKPIAGAPGRIDVAPPHPGRLSSVVPKIAGSTVLPKILAGPLVDRARAQAVDKVNAGASAPRHPDLKTPVMRPEIEHHVGNLKMKLGDQARAKLDSAISHYEEFAHESPKAMERWQAANILKAAIDHAETGKYDPQHVKNAAAKFKGMTADPDMGIVPKPAKPPAPKPEARPPAEPTEAPDWMHNGLFGGTAEEEPGKSGPRQPWEVDTEAWRGDEHPASKYQPPPTDAQRPGTEAWKEATGGPVPEGIPQRPEGLTPEEIYKIARRDIENATSDYKEEDLGRLDAAYKTGDPDRVQKVLGDTIGASLFRTLYPDYVGKNVEKAAKEHFGGTEPNLPVSFNVPSEYAGELMADYLEAHPPKGITAWHLKDMVSELRTGETRPERLFDPDYVRERWGQWNDKFKPFTPADFPGLKGLFKTQAPAEPGAQPPSAPAGAQPAPAPAAPVDKTQSIANKLNAQYGDKAIGMLQQKLAAWKLDPQQATKAARAEAVLKELERRKMEDAKGADFQLEDDDGAGPQPNVGEQAAAKSGAAAPFTPPTEHHAKINAAITQGLKAAGLHPDQAKSYQQDAQSVISRMTPQAAAHVAASLKTVRFHSSVDSLDAAVQAKYPKLAEELRNSGDNGKIGGLFDQTTGEMYVDGPMIFSDGASGGDLVHAHEMGHAIDGRDFRFSNDPEWKKAWQAEIANGELGDYGAKNPREGWAEICRLAYGHGVDPNELRKHMPLSAAFLAKHGLLPGSKEPFEKPVPIFDKAIEDPATKTHADTMLPEDKQFSAAMEDHVGFVPKHYITKDDGDLIYEVPTKAGRYTMKAEKMEGGIYDISFQDSHGSMSQTGRAKGAALGSMSAMGSALQTLIRDQVPREISFVAIKPPEGNPYALPGARGPRDESRANIYERFAKWIGERTGYEVKVWDGKESRAFDLVRKPDPLVRKISETVQQKYGDGALAKMKKTYDELKSRAEDNPNEPDLMKKMMRAREVYRELKKISKQDPLFFPKERPRTRPTGGQEMPSAAIGFSRKSKVPVSFMPHQGDNVEKFIKSVNPKLDVDELPSLFGVPDDSTKASVYMADNDTVAIDVQHPDSGITYHGQEEPHDIEIKLKTDKLSREPYIYIDSIFLKKSAQGKGAARNMVGSMIENAQKAGVKTLRCHAAKENPWDPESPHGGYYVWPRMGFDTPLVKVEKSFETAVKRGNLKRAKADEILGEMKKRWPEAQSILDIMNTTEGTKFWKMNGVDLYDTRFDTTPDSKSMKMWDQYQRNLQSKGGSK